MTTTFDDHDIRVALTDASLDAPRVDLWERIETDVIGLSRPRHPARQWLRSVAAVLTILLVGSGILAIFSLADDGTDRRAQQIESVPDLLLMNSWDPQTQRSSLRAYLPDSNGALTILDGVQADRRPVISPDGQQLIFTGWQQDGDTWTLRLWSFNSTTLATQWTTDVVSMPATPDGNIQNVAYSTTIAGNRVYVAWHAWDTPFPIPIRSIDRATGTAIGSWEIKVDEPEAALHASAPWLSTTADGNRLDVLTEVWDSGSTDTNRNRTAYFSFNLPDMHETRRVIQDESTPTDGRFSPWSAERVPNGRTLYAVNGGYYNDPMRVDFFDLDTGTVSNRVDLGFSTGFEISHQTAVSSDGRLLYVFDSISGKVATVDLIAQRLVGTANVDMSIVQEASRGSLLGRAWHSVSGLFVQNAIAKINFNGSMQFSADGSRLYAIGITGRDESPNGILVIETATWQVVEHWLPGQHPIALITGGNGRYLYAMTVAWANQGTSGMRIVDTTNGQEVVVSDELREAGDAFSTYSIAEIYRDTWGVSPAIAGVDPDDLSAPQRSDPFATMAVSVSTTTTTAGEPITIELRYLHPGTGNPITEDTDGVRFDEPGHVRAMMSKGNANGTEQTIVLARSEYGVYRGAAVPPSAGTWSIQVIAERDGEPSRYANRQNAVAVQPTLMGTDGKRYKLQVTTAETPPRAGTDTVVRVSIIDAETGSPLPAGVELTGGLPDEMDGSAILEQRAVTSNDLTAAGHGIYEGQFNFYATGRWTFSVNFPRDGLRTGAVTVGVIEVE